MRHVSGRPFVAANPQCNRRERGCDLHQRDLATINNWLRWTYRLTPYCAQRERVFHAVVNVRLGSAT
jgi:hypothetical protein